MNDGAPLSVAIKPKTKADEERLVHGLGKLLAEDPLLRVRTDPVTGDTVVAGTGELHLEIILDRLKREFNVEAGVGRPQVAYKETLTGPADAEIKYTRQTGDRGEYAHVRIHVSPGAPHTGVVFESTVLGGTIPGRFIAALNKGIQEDLMRGVLAGHPVDDILIELTDGSYHDVDSSEMAFTIAGSMAFQDAAKRANPVLLEPVMQVQVSVPPDDTDDVVENLTSRRGRVESHEHRGGMQIIDARVPLSEMFGYATDLRERTGGRGTFAMRWAFYQQFRPGEGGDGNQDSLVGAPLKPRPKVGDSSMALPEPDADGLPE